MKKEEGRSSSSKGLLKEIDPRIKLAAFLALIVLIAVTPHRNFMRFALWAALLVSLIIIGRLPWRRIFARMFLVFGLIVFLGMAVFFLERNPSGQRWLIFWNISVKSILVVLSGAVLSLSTDFDRLIKGLEKLHVPQIVTSLLHFTQRYLSLLKREAEMLWLAKKARDPGKWGVRRIMITGRLVFPLFFRAVEKSEWVYGAMLSRGYDGTLPSAGPLVVRRRDILFAVAFFVLLVIICVMI